MISQKRVVITGANSGIGFELLKRLAPHNRVIAVDKRDFRLKTLNSDNVKTFVRDISDRSAVDDLFDFIRAETGCADIFFANAGFGYFERLKSADFDSIRDIFAANVFSPIYSYEKFADMLGGASGQFVLTASGIGKIPVPGYALYGATKAALNAFEEALRAELPKNISLTAIYPVAINTDFYVSAVKGVNADNVELPTPKQDLSPAIDRILRGVENANKRVYTFPLFPLLNTLSALCPPLKHIYWRMQYKKLLKYEASLKNDQIEKRPR